MLRELGFYGFIMFLVFLIFVPLICTLIVAVGFANILGFTGIYWWAFIIFFYLILGTILSVTF